MITSRFAFIKIEVKNLPKMEQFYGTCLGFETRHRIDGPDFREALMAQAGSDFLLGLYCPDGQQEAGSATGAPGTIGLITENLVEALAWATGLGAKLSKGPLKVPGSEVAFVTDPEGNEIEFVQFLPS